MKKAGLILLILIYSLSSFGLTVKEFYCCGRLESISVIFANIEKSVPGSDDSKRDCCKTKYHSFKVKDHHVAATQIDAPLNVFTDLSNSLVSFLPNSLDIMEPKVVNVSHSPPLQLNNPIYISICIFRI